MGNDNYTEIARLTMRKNKGTFTKDEVSNILGNFMVKVMNKEREKMMKDEVIFCPLMSQVQLGPGDVQGTVKPIGMQATCFKERCGFWKICPANDQGLLLEYLSLEPAFEDDDTDMGIR
jgi:hypothetical protein